MATDYAIPDEPRRSRPFLTALIVAGIAFIAGISAMAYAVRHWDRAVTLIKGEPAEKPAPARAVRLVAPPPPPRAAPAEENRELADRISELEQRMSAIDARAMRASGNADRAEGLLVAIAARRALDRGAALGYIEGLLRERFGGSQPDAVATVISAAHQPVTLDELQTGFAEIAPMLAAAAPGESWWQGIRREMAGLIVVRRAETPSSAPSDRAARARAALASGRVDLALAEVARLPQRDEAAAWIEKARRYALARAALDRIETAALLQPALQPFVPEPEPEEE
jgi:hypothetical protein